LTLTITPNLTFAPYRLSADEFKMTQGVRQVFSLNKYLRSGANCRLDDEDDEEWELSDSDDEEEEEGESEPSGFFSCIMKTINESNKHLQRFIDGEVNKTSQKKKTVQISGSASFSPEPDDPTSHPHYWRDPRFHPGHILEPYLQVCVRVHQIVIHESFKLLIIVVIIMAG
jgi:hypothetical protein